jgi:NitT/TauT family transport system substrate-binding protein
MKKRYTGLLAAACALAINHGASAQQLEKLVYLTPAPHFLPGFGPQVIAQGRGYYREEGLDVSFESGKGGVDVAKQLGAGNAIVGGMVGDSPIIVRSNGVPIRIIASLGGRSLMQLVVREDSGIGTLKDLKGKKVSVMSFQDTGYYSLLGLLKSVGLTKGDLDIQALGPSGVWKFLTENKVQAMSGAPDFIPPVEGSGTKIRIVPSDEVFPSMAQVIGASDATIRERPDLLRRFVKATLRGMKDIEADPDGTADAFVGFTGQWKGQEEAIRSAFRYYAKLVYPSAKAPGETDPVRLAKLQSFYKEADIIRTESPVEELYTNQFIR